MEELVHHPSHDALARPPEADPGGAPDATHVGHLGEPLHGDELSGLGAAAPVEAITVDAAAPPSARRIGEGLYADGQNFQGRPNTSLSEGGGGGGTGAGGGSGL